jgi:hypothetical protein
MQTLFYAITAIGLLYSGFHFKKGDPSRSRWLLAGGILMSVLVLLSIFGII